MRTRAYIWHLTLLALVVAAVVAVPAVPAQAGFGSNPDQDSGWTRAGVVGGGCDPVTGVCDSEVTPGSPTLFEYRPDRETVGRNEGPAPSHGGDPTFVARQMCRFEGVDQGWSAGTWHHGAYWTLNIVNGQRSWSGPSRPHWAFGHSDTCRPLVQPTATPDPPTPTPPTGGGGGPGATPPPGGGGGQISISVVARVSGTPPSAGTPSGNGSGAYAPGATVRATVSYPSTWDQAPTWGGVTYSGCGQSGADWQVTFAAPAGGCTLTFVVRFTDPLGGGTPTSGPAPTPIPPCFTEQGYSQPMPVQFSDSTVRAVSYNAPVSQPLPDLPTNYTIGRVRTRTVDITFRPDLVNSTGGYGYNVYEPWNGGEMFIDIVDLGRNVEVATDDRTIFRLNAGRTGRPRKDSEPFSGDYGTRVDEYTVDPAFTPLGPMTWHAYTSDWRGGWYEQVYWMNNPAETGIPDERWPAITPNVAVERSWVRSPDRMGYRLNLQLGHYYDVRVRTSKRSCGEFYSAFTRARFLAGEARTVSGQIWDITNPAARVPAGSTRHQVTLDAIVGGQVRQLDRQQTAASTAAFNLVIARDDLEALQTAAGQPIDITAPIRFRMRFTPSNAPFRSGRAIYYPTDRAGEAPGGLSSSASTPLQVEWTASIQQMMAQEWPGAAFYVATFPYLPQGPSEVLFAHIRHADAGEPFETTRGNASPATFSWTYGATLEFYPDVELALPPNAGSWPGYTFATTRDRWWYLGSPPLGVANDQRLPEAPARVIWSKFPPPEARPPAVYPYQLSRIDANNPPVLDVQIDYTYRLTTPFGVESIEFTDQVRGLLVAEQVAPQVVP